METQDRFSWTKRGKSFGYAFRGIACMFATQHNSWIHAAVTLIVIAGAIWFRLTLTEWCLLALATGLVLAAEAFNTATEAMVNFISPDFNEKAGKIKDLGAAAVLIAAIFAAITGLIIFVPYFIRLF
ncbi:MAG: diacylglycerol kinase family protein [Bacteroidota bacterium]